MQKYLTFSIVVATQIPGPLLRRAKWTCQQPTASLMIRQRQILLVAHGPHSFAGISKTKLKVGKRMDSLTTLISNISTVIGTYIFKSPTVSFNSLKNKQLFYKCDVFSRTFLILYLLFLRLQFGPAPIVNHLVLGTLFIFILVIGGFGNIVVLFVIGRYKLIYFLNTILTFLI